MTHHEKSLAAILLGFVASFCRAEEPSMPMLAPLPTEDRSLAERFAVPPPSARILRIIHSQRENPIEQDKQLQSAGGAGLRRLCGQRLLRWLRRRRNEMARLRARRPHGQSGWHVALAL